jgi:hypothetical protein
MITAVNKMPVFPPTKYMLAVSGVTHNQNQQRVNLLERLVVFTSLQEFIINLIYLSHVSQVTCRRRNDSEICIPIRQGKFS